MFNFGNKKTKKIYLYALTIGDDKTKFLTVTNTKDECVEYAEMLIKVNHLNHYKMWAKLHELDEKLDSSWAEYYAECVTDEEKHKYMITQISYKYKDIAAILRMFIGCMPLGCSFDEQNEYIFLKNTMNAMKQNQKMQALYNDYIKAKAKKSGDAATQISDMANDEISEDKVDECE